MLVRFSRKQQQQQFSREIKNIVAHVDIFHLSICMKRRLNKKKKENIECTVREFASCIYIYIYSFSIQYDNIIMHRFLYWFFFMTNAHVHLVHMITMDNFVCMNLAILFIENNKNYIYRLDDDCRNKRTE